VPQLCAPPAKTAAARRRQKTNTGLTKRLSWLQAALTAGRSPKPVGRERRFKAAPRQERR